MKKLALLILITLILASCAAAPAVKSSASVAQELFIEGISPSYFDLSFEVPTSNPLGLSPSETVLKDEGKIEFDVSYHFSTVSKVKEYPLSVLTFNGCMQSVFVRLENANKPTSKIDGATVLNFQLFKRADFKEGAYVKLYDFEVPYAQLKDKVFYKTDKFVAVDVTNYLLGIEKKEPITLEESIDKRWPNGNPDKEYAISVREYYLENIEQALHKKKIK